VRLYSWTARMFPSGSSKKQYGPGVPSGPHLLHLTDRYAAPGWFAADRVEIFNHERDSFD
jgi:hypothetical protein